MSMENHPSFAGQNVLIHASSVDWDEYYFSHSHSPGVIYRRVPSETIPYSLSQFLDSMQTIGEYYHIFHPYPLVVPAHLARQMCIISYSQVIRAETFCCGEGDLMIVDDQYQRLVMGEDISDETPCEIVIACECGKEISEHDTIRLVDDSVLTKDEMKALWLSRKMRASYMNWLEKQHE